MNEDAVMEFSPGLVVIAGDAAGEALARHRETGELTLAPWIGVQADWVVLGATFIDGLRPMHRGDVFDPHAGLISDGRSRDIARR